MKALFKTEEELAIQQHLSAENAHHFDELARCSVVSVEGIATRSINLHAEHSDPPSSIAYSGLSMPGSAGPASNSKVGKRKSRASRKVPIRVFSVDTTNFMAMVHRLTGFQSSGSPQTSLLKPLATRSLHPFMQDLYIPDSPAGDKTTANFSNDSFLSTLCERKSSLSGRQQLDFIDDVSLSTKERFSTLHNPSSSNKLPPYIHNPAFKALHLQVLSNCNSWGPSSGVAFLPSQGGEPTKEDRRKEEGCMDLFVDDQRMLNEDVSPASHYT